MQFLDERPARLGVLVTIILMLSITLFMGSVFWLTTHGPWETNSNLELLKTDTNQKADDTRKSPPTTIEDALTDLRKSGCTITNYKKRINWEKVKMLDYETFKEQALINKVVMITTNELGNLRLLIKYEKELFSWCP